MGLASGIDRKLRTRSLDSLRAYLASRASQADLPASEARKLWTGLYYALWMTDRPRPQQVLASDLASLVLDLPPACAESWLRSCWSVLSLNWPRIDSFRLDKFLLLARRVFASQLRWLSQQRYQPEAVGLIVAILRTACFDVDQQVFVALGLRLHLLDLWVDELEREGLLPLPAARDGEDGNSDDQDVAARMAAFVQEVAALVDALGKSPEKAVRARARESLKDVRLPSAPHSGRLDDDDDDSSWAGIDDDGDG